MPTASSEMVIKAVKLGYLLMQKKRVTVFDVSDELEISRRCAHNWLLAASIVLPIYSPNEDTRLQTEPIIYELIDDLEYDPIERSMSKRMRMGIRYFKSRKANRQADNSLKPTEQSAAHLSVLTLNGERRTQNE